MTATPLIEHDGSAVSLNVHRVNTPPLCSKAICGMNMRRMMAVRHPWLHALVRCGLIGACGVACSFQAVRGEKTSGDNVTAPKHKMEVFTPAQWQVIQRDASGRGTVRVRVACQPAAVVEARLVLMEKASGKATDWRVLRAGPGPGTYEGLITAQAGGWYRLEVRRREGERVLEETSLLHVGVGEVFVTAGQSNSSNYGVPPLRPREDRVAAYGNGQWQPAADPMPGAKGEGGSPWCPLGDLLVRRLDVPVAFAAVGYHGVKAETWLPGGEAYPRLETALKELGPHGARAVLWHQGEADNGARTTSDQYYETMKRVIAASREAAGYPIPWFVARASYIPLRYTPPAEISEDVRGAQARLWQEGVAFQGPDTDDLRGPEYRCSDEIHMSERGLIVHGQRWFEQLMRQLFRDAGRDTAGKRQP
jgi:hypothetical protein